MPEVLHLYHFNSSRASGQGLDTLESSSEAISEATNFKAHSADIRLLAYDLNVDLLETYEFYTKQSWLQYFIGVWDVSKC